MIASPPPKLPSPWSRLRERLSGRASHYRTQSAIGHLNISRNERAAARVWPLTIWGFERLAERTYLDAFYRTIDAEYTRFARLPFPSDKKALIKDRVAASIRTVAAFSAWYTVVWNLIAYSLLLGQTLAWLSATSIVAFHFLQSEAVSGIVLSILIVGAILLTTSRVVAALPPRWPQNALILILAAATFATVAEYSAKLPNDPLWQTGLTAGATGATVLCTVVFLGVLFGQGAFQRVTWCKITKFPEEEIIQSTAFLLASLANVDASKCLPEERARVSEGLEWIACRFEQNLASRYLDGNSTADAPIAKTAAEYGEAFRMKKLAIAFPGTATIKSTCQFLWDALLKMSSSDWKDLERVPLPPPVSRPARAFSFLMSSAGIVLPLLIAIGVLVVVNQVKQAQQFTPLGWNVAITLGGWSLLSVLALLNPRQFDKQLAAATTLGDLLKQDPARSIG